MKRSCTGRAVAAVTVISVAPVFGARVPIRSTAERPRWVSAARRNAKVLASASAGRWMLRSNSPGRRTFWWLPVTKSMAGTSRGPPARGHSV